MNALRAHISGFLFKHKQAQVVVINVATLTSLGVRMAPWGLPLLVGAGWFIAPAIPNSIWKTIGLGAPPAPSSVKFKKGDNLDTIPVEK